MQNLLIIFIVLFINIFLLIQTTFASANSNGEILLPRIDLLPKVTCPVPEKEMPKPVSKPKDIQTHSGVSVLDYTATFNRPYDDVFIVAISALAKSPVTVVSFDSASGRIFCNYKNIKAIYAIVESPSSNSTIIKITPADGNYNIPLTIINKIFEDVNSSITVKTASR